MIALSGGFIFFSAWNSFPDKRHDSERQDGFSKSVIDSRPESIPQYSGNLYIELDGNKPEFNHYDSQNLREEKYSPLDEKGRCGTAFAKIDQSMMPNGNRGYIGNIKPTGWKQNKYPGIVVSEPPYIYN